MAANEMSERTRTIITVVVAVVINLGLGGLLYYAYGQYKDLEKKHAAKMVEKKKLQEYVAQEQTRMDELKLLQDRFRVQESKLPEQEQVATLIDDISKVAAKAECKLQSSTYVPSLGGGGGLSANNYNRSTWKTKWEASFKGWATLMNEMEEFFPRFVSFENLTISPKNSGVVLPNSLHEINVDIVTYQYIREAAAPAQ